MFNVRRASVVFVMLCFAIINLSLEQFILWSDGGNLPAPQYGLLLLLRSVALGYIVASLLNHVGKEAFGDFCERVYRFFVWNPVCILLWLLLCPVRALRPLIGRFMVDTARDIDRISRKGY